MNGQMSGNLFFRAASGGGYASALIAGFAAAVLTIVAFPASAFGQCQYEVTAIITPDDEDSCFPLPPSNTFGQGMNIHGDVVGFYTPCAIGNDEAFFWSQDTGFVTLPKPPGVNRAWAYDINDNRIIVGQHEVSGVGRKGFVYDMNKNDGEFQYLEPLDDGVTGQNISSANAVNNAGIAAGSRSIGEQGTQNPPSNAVIWDTNTGEVVDLGIQQGPNSAARDINETGIAAGWDGFSIPTTVAYVWNNDQIFDLGVVPGTDSSHANAVTEQLMVAGAGLNFTKLIGRAFVWQSGAMVTIPPVPPFTSSTALSVNSAGQVGLSLSVSGVFRAYLWQHGELHSINDLLVEGSGITLQTAGNINSKGQIRGSIGTKAVLLTPVDIPFADLNYDCKVNEHDLLLLLAAFGPQPVAAGSPSGLLHPADLNGDGIVNVSDLLIMLGNWNP